MKHAPLAALATLALFAAACGGGSAPAPSKPAPTPQKSTSAQPAASTPAPAAPAPAAPPAAQTAPAAMGAPSAAAVAQADQIFATRCTPCHGASGHGDGAAAAALNPKPRNYSDKAWQASITDEKIAKTIVVGGAAVGLSALMPPNPDLADKPDVVNALVAKIRGFGK